MKRILFICGAHGGAYLINFNGIKEYLSSLYEMDLVSCYDINQTDLSKYDAVFALAWMDGRVEKAIRGFQGIVKCAIVGSHVHIDREMHGMLRFYHNIFCVSPRIQDSLQNLGHSAVLVHYFYSPKQFYPVNLVHRPRQFCVGWAGNIRRELKRFPIFKQAVYNLAGIRGRVSFLNTTTGDDGRLLVTPEIPQAEMGGFYRSLSAYVVCSETEGQPKTGIEAMLCGIPVVSSDVGMMKDLGAFIIPEPFTVESLRLVLKRLQRSNDWGRALGAKSRELALSIFNERRVLSEWQSIFSGIFK